MALIPYIIQEDGFFYVAYKEKTEVPEIVVSSKGVANGLSEKFNDGWDFGPDSYDPTSTSKPPYTQTVGTQEAINYMYYNGGGKILIKKGLYDLSNAPFQTVTIIGGNTGNAILTIPANSSNTTINISLIGEGYPSGAWEETDADASSGEVTITWRNTTGTPPDNLFYPSAASEPNSYPVQMSNISLFIDNIHFQTAQNTSAVVVEAVGRFNAGTIYIDKYPVFSTGGTPSGNGLVLGTGIQSALSTIDQVYVESYDIGIMTAGHYHIGHAILQNDTIGFFSHPGQNGQYLIHVGSATIQYVPTLISTEDGAMAIVIDALDYGDGISSSDVLISNPNNNVLYAKININANSGTSGAPSLGTTTSNTFLKITGLYGIVPTTPSVPASGTAQQNTNLTTVKVYLYGGDVTEIQITKQGTAYTVLSVSTAIAMSGQLYELNPGDSITVTYSTAPDWTWLSD